MGVLGWWAGCVALTDALSFRDLVVGRAELWCRSARRLSALVVVVVAGACLAGEARAADTVTATAPGSVTLGASATASVPGAQVQDSTNASQPLQVTVSTTLGSLSLPSNTSGLTLAYGYSAFSGPTITFTGTAANANAALADMQLTGGGTAGTAGISVNVTPSVAGVYFLPASGHYYQYVATGSTADTWTQAATAANGMSFDGQQGYLAAVPNATVDNFIDSHFPGDVNIWAGGESTDFPGGTGPDGSYRAWYWGGQSGSTTPGQAGYGGPLAGQVFTECSNLTGNCGFEHTSTFFYDPSSIGSGAWYYASSSDQEPNNTNGTESYLAINYNFNGTATGKWNDFSNSEPTSTGFVVEYGDQPTGASSWTGSDTASSSSTLATAPGAPTAVAANPGATDSGNLSVSWTAPSTDNGSAITGYTVTATPTSGSTAAQSCGTTGATACTVSGLAPGLGYSVAVVATNAYGTSNAATATATAPLATPGAPTSVTVSEGAAGSRAMTVSWSAPASDGGSAITGYTVTATPQTGGMTQSCSTVSATSCTINGLPASTTYTVSVTDTTAAGTSPAASTSAQSPAAVTPDAPTSLTATPGAYGSGQLDVAWTAPVNDGDSPITDYTVTATPQSGGGSTQTCMTTTATSCTVAGLDPGAAYTVTVAATNAVGTGAAASTSASAPASAPGVPTGLSATAGVPGSAAISVSWSAPASNGGDPITGYTATATSSNGASAVQTCATTSATACTITSLEPGVAYIVTVTATTAAGTSANATTYATAPVTTVPDTPSSLVAVPGASGSGAITLSWSTPAGDGGSAITGYTVTATALGRQT
jgi:Tfp pilus assembly protein PilE